MEIQEFLTLIALLLFSYFSSYVNLKTNYALVKFLSHHIVIASWLLAGYLLVITLIRMFGEG